jgi:hypothetical protein
MSLLKTLTEKPWERKGIIGGLNPEGAFESPPERVALGFFLTIASVIFSMFGVSYVIRMSLPDWEPLAEPSQLWLNTGLLAISSIVSMGKKYSQCRQTEKLNDCLYRWRRFCRAIYSRADGYLGKSAGYGFLRSLQPRQLILLSTNRFAYRSLTRWALGVE